MAAARIPDAHSIAGQSPAPLEERIQQWFIAKGVPWFGPEPSRDLLGFALPLLAIVLAFELVAIPWLAFGHVQEVLAHLPGGAVLGDGPRLALAIAGVILAVLLAIAPAVPLCRGALPRRRPGALPWRLDAVIRAGSCLAVVVVRFAPLGAVILWLSREDAFVGLRAGDFLDAAACSVLLIVGIRAVLNGATSRQSWAAGILLVPGAFLSTRWDGLGIPSAPGGLLRPSALVVAGCVVLFTPANGWRRLAEGDRTDARGARVATMLAVLALQLAVLPFVWRTSTDGHLVLCLTVLLIPLAVLELSIRRRLDVRETAAGLKTRWPTRRVLGLSGAVFVLLPACVALGAGLSDVSRAELAGTMAAVNLLAFVVITSGASLGMHHVYEWITSELFRDSTLRSPAMRRGAPIVLIFIYFLFFTGELWNLAAHLDAAHFWVMVAVTLGLAVVLLIKSARQTVAEKGRFESFDELSTFVEAIPDEELHGLHEALQAAERQEYHAELSRAEDANIVTILVTKAALRMLVIGAVVTAVLFAVGSFVIDDAVLASWQVDNASGHSASYLAIRVSAFLGAFSSLYLVGEALRDDDLRRAAFSDLDDAIRRRLAVRLAFRNTCACHAAATRPSEERARAAAVPAAT